MSIHILPVPSWCVQTQSFAEHVARAKAMGCAYKPGMTGYSCWYYGGLDLAPTWANANKDVPITASSYQTIKEIIDESPKGYGLNIRAVTDDGELVIYAHLSRTYATPGRRVAPGDVIGLMGSTGNSTGKHLHWEIRVNGIPVDPRSLMVAATPAPEPEPPAEFKMPVIPEHDKALCLVNSLRVRVQPISGKTIGQLNKGDVVTVLDCQNGEGKDIWFCVLKSDETVGWSAAYYGGETWIEVAG